MAKQDEFKLRISKTGDFGKIGDAKGERRSASAIHSAGHHDIGDDAVRRVAHAVQVPYRGKTELPEREIRSDIKKK